MLIQEEIVFLRNTRDGHRVSRILVFDTEWGAIRWEGERGDDRDEPLYHGDHELILVNREQWDKAPHLKPGRYLGRVISHHIAGEEMDRCLADCDDCTDYLMGGE
jgi:hypothetical protein